MAEIAYGEAVRSVSGQEASFDELRSRTGLLFVGASISVALLGAPALEDGWGVFELLGAALLGVVIFSAAIITTPRELRFRADAEELVSSWVDDPHETDADEMYRDLAIYLTRAYRDNAPVLQNLTEWYRVGLVGTMASLSLFGLALWVG